MAAMPERKTKTFDLRSCQEAGKGTDRMKWRGVALKMAFVIGVIGVGVLSLLPARDAPSLFNDKLEHLIAYASLGLVGGLAFPTWRATLWMILLLPLLAVAMELGQEFVPGRSTEIADAIFSGTGAWLTLLPWLVIHLIERAEA
jgi:VanZ family protein